MPYGPYADETYYKGVYNGIIIPDVELEKVLRQASRHIDSLTYSRIVGRGFDKLTPFQQELIQEVCCQQADFEWQNREIFDMILQGYSINGVSMQFGESWNVTIQKGIPIRRDVYEQLCQTGLCCRLLGV
ncbi:MAG: hypothetical protein MSA90_18565 [Faecalicatena sp.]|uniref:hypothetical protein n=1 Tax=Faecalicatena sp. TaxID=2005360 RepID=UPI00258D4EFB|nr:hypothetical protein [Faecalicatena sp.]MCI6467453.1 hypothetical protein [Faecalicatena sp.]MDY5618153.1 hypothetical protein [Lachnospiraceae bacterium]